MPTRLTIQEQPSLSWRKEAEIAMDGIHFRLMRSLLTLSVVVLAVAFITNILVEARIAQACKQGVHARAEQHRQLVRLAAFTDAPLASRDLASRLADLPPGGWPLDALSAWLGMPPATLRRFQEECMAWRDAEQWLDGLAPGHRRLLAGNRDINETFGFLDSPGGQRAFADAAHAIPLQVPRGFLPFAARRRAFLADLDAVTPRLETARARLAALTGSNPFADWLASVSAEQAASVLADAGLSISPERLSALRRQASDRTLERGVLDRLDSPGLPAAWRGHFNEVFEKNKAISQLVVSPERAEWLLARTGSFQGPVLNAGTARQTAARIRDARILFDTDSRLKAHYGATAGLSTNMFWLLVVSFLVCMAGITNAMLLSVIERFREIATMKCLGALNGFIARLFLLEAACLGLAGGVLGVLLGGAIGVIRMFAAYGEWVARFFPWGAMASTAGIATASGLILATLSALYPAWSAARMPPIEAMRVE